MSTNNSRYYEDLEDEVDWNRARKAITNRYFNVVLWPGLAIWAVTFLIMVGFTVRTIYSNDHPCSLVFQGIPLCQTTIIVDVVGSVIYLMFLLVLGVACVLVKNEEKIGLIVVLCILTVFPMFVYSVMIAVAVVFYVTGRPADATYLLFWCNTFEEEYRVNGRGFVEQQNRRPRRVVRWMLIFWNAVLFCAPIERYGRPLLR